MNERPMRFLVTTCFLFLISCRPPCERPLAEFCRQAACAPLAQWVTDGGCASATLSECGAFKVLGFGGRVATSIFFEADGGVVGVQQDSDIAGECGSSVQSFGNVPACSVTSSMQVCTN